MLTQLKPLNLKLIQSEQHQLQMKLKICVRRNGSLIVSRKALFMLQKIVCSHANSVSVE